MSQQRDTQPQVCDLLIVNAVVITMNNARDCLADGAIAITGCHIRAVGPTRELQRAWTATRQIDAEGGIVHPGFIDGHYHAGLHLSRGSLTDNPNPTPEQGGPGTGMFVRWLNALTQADEYASALMASVELVRNGFTGYVEASTAFWPEGVARAAQAVGIRCSVTDCMMWDMVGGEPMAALIPRAPCLKDRSEREMGSQLKRNGDANALVRGHVSLYGLGSSSPELMAQAKQLADSHQSMLHQHQSFMQADSGFDAMRFGKPALEYFLEHDLIGPRSVFTHMNFLTEREVEAVKASGMALVWHPGNVVYYGLSQTARNWFPKLHRDGVAVGFGTDVAKAWTFGDLGHIAYLSSRERSDYLAPSDILAMFTLGGARAIGLDGRTGIIAVGMLADIVIRTSAIAEAQPDTDSMLQLALIMRTKGVDTVICNGEIIVENGRLTRLDEKEVHSLARESARRIGIHAGRKRGMNGSHNE